MTQLVVSCGHVMLNESEQGSDQGLCEMDANWRTWTSHKAAWHGIPAARPSLLGGHNG